MQQRPGRDDRRQDETTRAFLRGRLNEDCVAAKSLTGDEVLAQGAGSTSTSYCTAPDANQLECVDWRSPLGLGCYVAVRTLDGQDTRSTSI